MRELLGRCRFHSYLSLDRGAHDVSNDARQVRVEQDFSGEVFYKQLPYIETKEVSDCLDSV